MKVNENLIQISGRPALTRGFNPLEFAAHVRICSTIPKIVQAANSLKFQQLVLLGQPESSRREDTRLNEPDADHCPCSALSTLTGQ